MKKIERLEREAQKAREKIAAMQALLKEIDGKRTEQEDLQIIKRIRALNLTRDELYAFMSSGALPASLAVAIDGDITDPADTDTGTETIYTRRDKNKKRNKNAPDAEMPEGEVQESESTADTANIIDSTNPGNQNHEAINNESEGITYEG